MWSLTLVLLAVGSAKGLPTHKVTVDRHIAPDHTRTTPMVERKKLESILAVDFKYQTRSRN